MCYKLRYLHPSAGPKEPSGENREWSSSYLSSQLQELKFNFKCQKSCQLNTKHTNTHTKDMIHYYSMCLSNGTLPSPQIIFKYCHMYQYDYRWVLDWWPNLLDSLIHRVATLYNSYYINTLVSSHVFTNCSSVAASNNGHSPSSGFLNYIQPHLPASNSNSS
jgi:hypothetical protein